MIRIALTGDIGSGKTFISKLFGYPVFNADEVVIKIYKKNKKVFSKLKKKLPNTFTKFPISKEELIKAILKNKNNIKKISDVVHPVVRKNLINFLKKNKPKKFVILDIPLYLENKLYKKKDIIIFIYLNKNQIMKKIKKRKNFDKLILRRLKSNQLPLSIKRKKSNYVLNNDFNKNSARKKVKDILKKLI